MNYLYALIVKYKLLIIAIFLLFLSVVFLQVNYNKNKMDSFHVDERYTVAPIKYKVTNVRYMLLNGSRLFAYLFYPGAIVGMMQHMGGNVWYDTYRYPGHNYFLKEYLLKIEENTKDSNLRYFNYYLRLQAILFMFLTFIPLIFYLWKNKYFIAMFMIASLVGINFIALRERSVFYVEPLLLSMINIVIWFYFYIYDKKEINRFWIILSSFICALTFSLKFSCFFLILLLVFLILSKFKELESRLKVLILYSFSFLIFSFIINWNMFFPFDIMDFSEKFQAYFSNFWHYSTGHSRVIPEDYPFYNLTQIINGIFYSLGYLIYIFPIILIISLIFSSRKEKMIFGLFSLIIIFSLYAITKQRVYINRNFLPFLPSIILITGVMLDITLRTFSKTNIFNINNKIIFFYLFLLILIILPNIFTSSNYFTKLIPIAKKNIASALLKVKNAKERRLVIIDFPEKLVDTNRFEKIK